MVNFGLNSASLLGVALMLFGMGLLLFSRKRRNYDRAFLTMIGLSGFILLFQGWRLDPTLQINSFILGIITAFYYIEDIIRR